MVHLHPGFWVTLAWAPFHIACMVFSFQRMRQTPNYFTRMMHLQNWFALWFLVGALVTQIDEYTRYPGFVIVNWGLGPSSLIHAVLLLNRLGLFRMSITWYTPKHEKIAVYLTILFHFAMFIPSYMEFWFSQTEDFDTLPGWTWMYPWLYWGVIVWFLFMYILDFVTSYMILRVVLKTKAESTALGINDRSSIATTTAAAATTAAENEKSNKSSATDKSTTSSLKGAPTGALYSARATRRQVISTLALMVFLDIIAVAFGLIDITGELGGYAQLIIIMHYTFGTIFMTRLSAFVRQST